MFSLYLLKLGAFKLTNKIFISKYTYHSLSDCLKTIKPSVGKFMLFYTRVKLNGLILLYLANAFLIMHIFKHW